MWGSYNIERKTFQNGRFWHFLQTAFLFLQYLRCFLEFLHQIWRCVCLRTKECLYTSELNILLTIYIGFCLIIAQKAFWVNVRLFASQYLCFLVDFVDQTWGWSLLCVSDHFNFQLLQFLCVILGILVDSALLCDCFGSALPFFVISQMLFLVVFHQIWRSIYLHRKEYFYVIIQYIDDYLNK